MHKLLNESDSIKEKLFINGNEVEIENGGVQTHGLVTVNQFTGNTLIKTRKRKNKLLVSGSVFLSEKSINKRSNFNPPSIDVVLGVGPAEELNAINLQQEEIIGIMVGIGGSDPVYGTVKAVQPHKKMVPTPVPFRIVDVANDLVGAERGKYFLRVVEGAKVKYYGKKFEAVNTKVLFENGTEVPLNVDTLDNPGEINVFNEFQATVDTKDIREYFIENYGDTSLCQVNSVGLLVGFPKTNAQGNIEYKNVRCITTANMPPNPLRDDLSIINFIYQLIKK